MPGPWDSCIRFNDVTDTRGSYSVKAQILWSGTDWTYGWAIIEYTQYISSFPLHDDIRPSAIISLSFIFPTCFKCIINPSLDYFLSGRHATVPLNQD